MWRRRVTRVRGSGRRRVRRRRARRRRRRPRRRSDLRRTRGRSRGARTRETQPRHHRERRVSRVRHARVARHERELLASPPAAEGNNVEMYTARVARPSQRARPRHLVGTPQARSGRRRVRARTSPVNRRRSPRTNDQTSSRVPIADHRQRKDWRPPALARQDTRAFFCTTGRHPLSRRAGRAHRRACDSRSSLVSSPRFSRTSRPPRFFQLSLTHRSTLTTTVEHFRRRLHVSTTRVDRSTGSRRTVRAVASSRTDRRRRPRRPSSLCLWSRTALDFTALTPRRTYNTAGVRDEGNEHSGSATTYSATKPDSPMMAAMSLIFESGTRNETLSTRWARDAWLSAPASRSLAASGCHVRVEDVRRFDLEVVLVPDSRP